MFSGYDDFFSQTKEEMKSTNIQLPQQNRSSTKIFESLAQSRADFKSVGKIVCITENTKMDNYVRQNGFKVTPSRLQNGSGVYLGNQMVITAAHCIPDSIPNNTFINTMTDHLYFFTEDNQFARIIMATSHPLYRGQLTWNDIGLLLLDREINNIEPISINYKPISLEYNCIAVGFTNIMTPRYEDNVRIPVINDDTLNIDKIIKVAVKIPYVRSDSSSGYLMNKIGYSFSSIEFRFFGTTLFENLHAYDPLEAGIYKGMSGGGCFSQSTLIGLNSCHVAENNDDDKLSRIANDRQYFTPLFNHKSWIEEVAQSYREQLPLLMITSNQWYLDREKYEKNQFQLHSKIAPPIKLNIHCHNKKLPITYPDKTFSLFVINFSLFKQYEKYYLVENRHNDPKIQREYDKRFGLVAVK